MTGQTGDWKNHFSPELNQKIDEWISKNLTGSDLKFVTELDKQDWKKFEYTKYTYIDKNAVCCSRV